MKERPQFKNWPPEDLKRIVLLYIFDVLEFRKYIDDDFYSNLKAEEIKLSTQQKYTSASDLAGMINYVDGLLNAGSKVIVVSHSQGNIYANDVYQGLLARGKPVEDLNENFGNLQIASVAQNPLAKNSDVYSLNHDLAINLFSKITGRSIAPQKFAVFNPSVCTFTGAGTDFDLCHDLPRVYMSPSVTVYGPRFGKGSAERTGRDTFIDMVEEVAWKLANNDDNCCNGEDGRFFVTKITDGKIETGGFVALSVKKEVENKEKEFDNIFVEKESEVCGEVTLEAKGIKKIKIKNNSEIDGQNQIKITGNVEIINSKLGNSSENEIFRMTNIDEDLPMRIIGSDLFSSAPTIEGPVRLQEVKIPNNAEIKAVKYVDSQGSKFQPSIENSTIYGSSKISGFYYIQNRDINSSTIEGTPAVNSYGSWQPLMILPLVNEDPVDRIFHSVTIKGSGQIEGKIAPFSNLNGYKISENIYGASIRDTSHFQGKADGTFIINGGASVLLSHSSPLLGNTLRSDGSPLAITGGTFESFVSISGAPRIVSSSFIQGTITGEPYISGSTFVGDVSISCNAFVVGKTDADGQYYGCNYPNKKSPEVSLAETLEYLEATRLRVIAENYEQQKLYADF